LKEKKKNLKWVVLAIVLGAVLIPSGWVLFSRLEGKKPEVQVILPGAALGLSQEITVKVDDVDSGIRRVKIALYKDGKERVLADERFAAVGTLRGGQVKEKRFVLPVEPRALGFEDGAAVVRVTADDYAWRRWWNGNRRVLETPVRIDTRAPMIDVLSKFHNVTQGGSGFIAYRIDEKCPRHGVRVGDRFFPGHPAPFGEPGTLIAFFAVAYDQGPGTPLVLEAVDEAGNVGRSGFAHHLRQKRFKADKIRISDRFLAQILPKFDATVPAADGEAPIDRFLRINRDLRRANYDRLSRIGDSTEARFFWKGEFGRLPGSAREASFADQRQYLYRGRVIDREVHLGVDLASVNHSPVPAANAGKVVLAEEVGIYGKTVALDHGFGLFSLYSHLSRIDVQPGAVVSKGDILGRTGTSGLAGGDHLHFSMMVAHTFVDPVEWWDAAWIRNNVTVKIKALAEAGKGKTQ
jgi:murein DD-endopeptidase MepM/ murein hydrolase activator NlpD